MVDLNQCFQHFVPSFGAGILVGAFMLVNPVSAQQEPGSSVPTIDPVADGLLQDLGDYLDGAEQFTFDAQLEVDELSSKGQKINYASNISVAVQRPGRFYVFEQGDLRDRTLWFDEGQFTLLDRDLNHYVSVDTPTTISETILFLEDAGFVLALSDFVGGNFYKGVTANIQTSDYLGLHHVGDELCHHLAFTQDNIDWQIWIADGYEITPCKFIITYKNLPGSPQYTAYFSNWNFSPRLPDRLFEFAPPEGAGEVELRPRQ